MDIGLPSLNGLMMLFSAKTGLAEALFLDNGYLTDVRTAAAGAVAAKYLAPGNVTTAGVIGTCVQARLQIAAAHMVRPFRRVLVEDSTVLSMSKGNSKAFPNNGNGRIDTGEYGSEIEKMLSSEIFQGVDLDEETAAEADLPQGLADGRVVHVPFAHRLVDHLYKLVARELVGLIPVQLHEPPDVGPDRDLGFALVRHHHRRHHRFSAGPVPVRY